MADISKIKLPSGNEYDIKDATARQMISGGVSFIIAWDGTSTPVVADIPSGVVVTYGGTDYTGTMSADSAEAGAFYLVKSATQAGGTLDKYDEYVPIGTTGSKTWEKIGDTQLNLSDVVTGVTLNKQTTDFVTGYASPTTSNFVTGYASPTTDTFVKSVSAETNKNLVTTSITGVSGSTTASKATAGTSQTTADGTGTASSTNTDWLKGVSVSNEVLIIGAATMDTQTTTQFTFVDVTVPVAASSATTVATGATSTTGTGDAVVTGVNIGSSASAITALGTPSTSSAITALGTPSTSAGLNNSTSITVTKGNA